MDRLTAGARLIVLAALSIHLHHHIKGPAFDYAGLAAASAASWAGLPGPGEPVLIAAAIFAARHSLDITSVIVVAFLAAMGGGVAGWLVGLVAGRRLITARGPLHKVRVKAVKQGEELFRRHPVLAVLLTPSWVAGIERVSTSIYLTINTVGAVIWAAGIGLGAYFAGPPVVDFVDDFGVVTTVALALLIGASILVERRRRHRLAARRSSGG